MRLPSVLLVLAPLAASVRLGAIEAESNGSGAGGRPGSSPVSVGWMSTSVEKTESDDASRQVVAREEAWRSIGIRRRCG